MEIYKIKDLSFAYPNRSNTAIDNINLTIKSGEFITLCGKSGCGKTTLLRLLKPSLSPFGNKTGEILFNGSLIDTTSAKNDAIKIGFVMQNPDNQIVTDKVWHELSFGLESLGYSTPEIRARVSEMASFFGIQNWFYKNVSDLSGGQKQLLCLASVMVMQPDVLILDEPTSQLDPIAATDFLKTIERINRELGTTVILSEHRLEDAILMSDRVIVMDSGKIIADCPPNQIGDELKTLNCDMFLALPTPIHVHSAVENNLPCPLTIRDGRLWLKEYSKLKPLNKAAIPGSACTNDAFSDVVIEVKNAYFRYEKDSPDVISNLNMKVHKGELYTILGGNAVGKTTALSLIAGIETPYRGKVYIKGVPQKKLPDLYSKVLGVLPQNPQVLFTKSTIFLDLMDALSNMNWSQEEKRERIKNIATLCRIDDLLNYHPYDLSGGEQQRAALAKVLLKSPEVILMDEPTKGQDSIFKQEFAMILDNLKSSGVTIVMVSHDVEFCAKYADRCAMFFNGSITSEGNPRDFFSGKAFYTTAANKMARGTLDSAVLAEDIILACGSKSQMPSSNPEKVVTLSGLKTKKSIGDQKIPKNSKHVINRALIGVLLILLAVPLTLISGSVLFQDKKYYFISIMIIIETICAFFMSFESGKPRARELVIISVLCAIAVSGRAAFYMVPQIKPVAAIVIISGVCLGGEAGFLVGAATAFTSNMFFGQGPWTPWQMFAFGIIGFAAGIIFKKSLLRKNIPALCVFGFLATLILYGGITNPASVIMTQGEPTLSMIIASYIAGFPLDIMHSLSTAVFLALIGKPMIEKLERIKTKFGI